MSDEMENLPLVIALPSRLWRFTEVSDLEKGSHTWSFRNECRGSANKAELCTITKDLPMRTGGMDIVLAPFSWGISPESRWFESGARGALQTE
jgi:hypothetical protein